MASSLFLWFLCKPPYSLKFLDYSAECNYKSQYSHLQYNFTENLN